jgi:hypothetical protein
MDRTGDILPLRHELMNRLAAALMRDLDEKIVSGAVSHEPLGLFTPPFGRSPLADLSRAVVVINDNVGLLPPLHGAALRVAEAFVRRPLDRRVRAVLNDALDDHGRDDYKEAIAAYDESWQGQVARLFALLTRTGRRKWLKSFRRATIPGARTPPASGTG